jgi:Domain of unknown function (DUF4282)
MSTPSNGSWNEGQEPGPQYGGQPGGQPGYGQQSLGQGFGQQGGYAPAGQPPPGPQQGPPQQQGGALGGGVADLFSDFGFRKNLTESIASIAFLITVVWAVLKFITVLANAWGSQDFGTTKVKNMGGFEAMMATLSGLAWMVFVIVVARLFFELCINIARMARNRG